MTRSTRLRPIALFGTISLVALVACNNNNPTPVTRLEPTRTVAPRPPEAPSDAQDATAQAPASSAPLTGLTADNVNNLKPAFSLNEPPARHIYSVADDRLTIYNNRNFEIFDAASLQPRTRTEVEIRNDAGQGFWYAASTNGKAGAIMQTDGSVDIYDLDSGKVTHSFTVPEPSFEVASDIALSDDGSELVVVAQGEVRRVNVADGKITGDGQTLPIATTAIRFSEDASRIAAVQATGEVVIVNAVSGQTPITLTEVFTAGNIVNFNFSPNGRKFGAATNDTLRVWDLSGGAAQVQQEFNDLNGAVDPVFDRSGKYLAAVSGPAVYLYDLDSRQGQNEFRLSGGVPVWSANFDPKGETLFIAGSGELASFRVSDGEPLQATTRPPLTRAAFAPDGRTLATWSATFASPNVALMNTATGDIANRLAHEVPLRWLTHSPGGKYIATLTLASTVHVWDASNGDAVLDLRAPQTNTLRALLCFSNDETSLAYLEGDKVILQPMQSGGKPTSFDLPFTPAALTTCANDKRLTAAASENAIEVIDLGGKRVAQITEDVDFAEAGALYFNQDGSRLAALSRTQLIVWDVATQKQLQKVRLQREPLLGLFNPAGDKFALNFNDDVDVIDVGTGKAVSLDLPRGSTVTALFPRDPRLIVTAIQMATTESAALPVGQRNYVSGALSIWDAATGELIRTIETDEPILTAEISDDGGSIATSTSNNALTVWSTP